MRVLYHADLDRIDLMLSIGERFLPEEILLILGIRDTLQVVKRLLTDVFYVDLQVPLDDADEIIQRKIGKLKLVGKSSQLYHALYFQDRSKGRRGG